MLPSLLRPSPNCVIKSVDNRRRRSSSRSKVIISPEKGHKNHGMSAQSAHGFVARLGGLRETEREREVIFGSF